MGSKDIAWCYKILWNCSVFYRAPYLTSHFRAWGFGGTRASPHRHRRTHTHRDTHTETHTQTHTHTRTDGGTYTCPLHIHTCLFRCTCTCPQMQGRHVNILVLLAELPFWASAEVHITGQQCQRPEPCANSRSPHRLGSLPP